MNNSKGKEYILSCCEQGCLATLSIIVETNPPGFLPNKEVSEEARKVGWSASIIQKGQTFCPQHKKRK